MKAKTKYQLIWFVFLMIFGTMIVNYNLMTFDSDVKVVLIKKYKTYREHKGHVYYDDDNKAVVRHRDYGCADIRVDITTYENHKPGDTLIFSWNQRELERHFNHYPERPLYLQMDFVLISSFVLLIICIILSFIVPSDQ